MTYNEALHYIHNVTWRGSKLGLERTRELLSKLGNPEKALKFIHIAGTNGKGSVSAMLASVLKEAGYKTGLYTSPYILEFNERMQINGEPISNEELADLTGYIADFAETMSDPPTEFELITVLAFEYFKRNGCDIVVLEVGMGGELDSTNVIDTPELSIITTIDYDHVRELGPTMRDIASAKAGIIKQNGKVLFYGENPEAEAVIREKCAQMNASLNVLDFSYIINKEISLEKIRFDFGAYEGISVPLVGSYQFKNAAMALSAIDIIRNNSWNITREAVYKGMATVKWRGRFEVLMHNPLFISDGGHNPQGINSAIESFKTQLPGKKAVFILGIMADKDVDNMVNSIEPVASEFITVKPDNPRAMSAYDLKEHLLKFGKPVTACDTVLSGVKTAIQHAGKDGIVFSLGSLYQYREVHLALKTLENQAGK